MEIHIGKHKFHISYLIVIVLLFSIINFHLCYGCSNINLMETMTNLNSSFVNNKQKPKNNSSFKEGFGGSMKTGPIFSNAKSSGYIMPPSTWRPPTLTYSSANNASSGATAIMNRPAQQIPLPKGQLDMFSTTPFKKECCPNSYSNSSGCACMTTGQYNALHTRFGNNVPYSEY